MQTKIVNLVFISLFISVLLSGLLFMDSKTEISEVEKRTLTSLPQLFVESKLNTQYFSNVDKYINDRFGFKSMLINLDNNIKYKVFNKIGNDNALVGTNGWLYYINKSDGDNFSDFLKNNLVDQNVAHQFAEEIRNRAEWCKENGIKFIFLIAPNKHSVYPEYYPVNRPEGLTRTDQFTKAMDNLNIDYIFPRDFLIGQKSNYPVPLYIETDTHWNQLGAYLTFNIMLSKIKEQLKEEFLIPKLIYESTINVGDGDIPPMLGLNKFGKITTINFKPDNSEWSDYYSYIKNEGRSGIITHSINNNNLPKALIFRDSFFTALQPFTSLIFAEAEYRWKPFAAEDKESILQNKPDIIIWEVVERYTGNIANQKFN